ncbi:hypothetical protein PMI41_04469 [Phyllobacterium sp. YR531]|nr:hypothetical protein PMI41_04469 [Phyllobacterium sp. YR531]
MFAYEIYWVLTWIMMPLFVTVGALLLGNHEVKQSQKDTDILLANIAHELKRRATPAE